MLSHRPRNNSYSMLLASKCLHVDRLFQLSSSKELIAFFFAFIVRVLGWNWQKLQPKIKKTITLKNSIVTCYIAWKRQRWVQWNSVLTAWRATDILYTGNAMRAQFTCLTMDSVYCTSNEHNKWKHFLVLVPLREYKSLDVNSLVTVGRIELRHGDTCCYTSHCWNCWNVMWLTFPRTTLTWLDSEDDYHSGS